MSYFLRRYPFGQVGLIAETFLRTLPFMHVIVFFDLLVGDALRVGKGVGCSNLILIVGAEKVKFCALK
jgi:hypothetical protein